MVDLEELERALPQPALRRRADRRDVGAGVGVVPRTPHLVDERDDLLPPKAILTSLNEVVDLLDPLNS